MLMEREELIQLLMIDLENRSSMPARYWKVHLNQMTDEELQVVLEMVEKLKKEDLVPCLKILSKYHKNIANGVDDGDDFIGLN